ncbi:beta-phosphoglucomutase [Merismopedia glauca]|uniref:Beta-phosphoglucomutase n=1 Tax=Merismopedia glauca CCAP 1448/3 TaxID=1296344 RepID=A0A2T1C0Z0_9CYAN|nr:beta-phosphoglucomutase [Merismopedia glauca]PSB01793.1 beta-phosphoglucomutase [Merismopedia glauca CCAP 1448/3]
MEALGWTVVESKLDYKQAQEALFTIGNGYLGTRGALEEGYPSQHPVTLIHGVYDDVPVVYTELVNCPNWLSWKIKIDGETFRCDSEALLQADRGDILHYERRLDLRSGVLLREVTWRSPRGHTVELRFERFASISDRHVLAQRCQIKSVDFAATVEFEAQIDSEVDNQGLNHWEDLKQGDSNLNDQELGIWLEARTSKSEIQLAMAAKLVVADAEAEILAQHNPGCPSLTTQFFIHPGQTVNLEKLVTVFTSREVDDPKQSAWDKLQDLPSYMTLLAPQMATWRQIWENSDVLIEGDLKAQLAVRYNLFQLLIAAPRHDDTVSIPAKTLSGFGYRGHVFWDTEIFILPFFIYTQPELARNLLMYRYRTLPGARRKAQEGGYEGALFAWESAGTGDEVTPRWVPDKTGEMIRIWCRDIELHINTDVAYGVWKYWQVTGDDAWLQDYGAEIILDTAIFWASRVEWNRDRLCYEISDVIGPDENHEHVDNNAFTNGMVRWHLERALQLWSWLEQRDSAFAAQLARKINLTDTRLSKWVEIVQKIEVKQDQETCLIEQFDGFLNLEDVNLTDYEPRSESMQAILGISETNQRQILKQPDVLMLLYLLGDHYEDDGSACSRERTLATNWDYYHQRTDRSYGSSLAPAIHSILASQMQQPQAAYEDFMQAALVDLDNLRGNTAEGIHGACAGGVWQAIVFGFAGVRLTPNGFTTQPQLPPGWTRLKFRLQWQEQWYEFDLRPQNTQPSTMPEIQGVIFDLDGVLTDTADFHYLGWKQLADEMNIPFDSQINEGMRGLPRRESLLHILGDRQVPAVEFEEMMERKNGYYLKLIEGISPDNLLPGVRSLLEQLRSHQIKIGIGSSSKNARMVLEKLGIAEFIEAIADGYSVSRPKPAPDLFLHAANLLHLEPEKCLVVEDAGAGVEAALAANMWALGVGPHERLGHAHLVLPSLENTSWEDLQRRLNEVRSQFRFAI